MGLRRFFSRRSAASKAASSVVVSEAQESLTPKQIEELQEAWAELAQAAEWSGVTGLHACSRNGRPWEEDPAAVREMAATLRAFRPKDEAANN